MTQRRNQRGRGQARPPRLILLACLVVAALAVVRLSPAWNGIAARARTLTGALGWPGTAQDTLSAPQGVQDDAGATATAEQSADAAATNDASATTNADTAESSGTSTPATAATDADPLATTIATQVSKKDAEAYAWDEDLAPNYVRVIGTAYVADDAPEEGVISYAALDRLGRAGRVVGTLNKEMVEEAAFRGRQELPDWNPTGWDDNDEVKVELAGGGTYTGYFWNRSHLMADSLGGAATPENLITGTRMQNVGDNSGSGGMAHPEGKARSWLEADDRSGTLYYAATPVYVEDDLVARAVIVDVRSSDGAIDERAIVYNAAKGYLIDYASGNWWKVS